jgi:uncharacterized protein (TIGR00255 family)
MSSMAVYSMTGYAGASASLGSALTSDAEGETSTKTHATGGINIELRSVNSRFLDLVLRLPDELRGLEPALRELVTQSFRRGKIELRLSSSQQNESACPQPQAEQLMRLANLQNTVVSWLPQARPLSVNEVMQWCKGATVTERLDEVALQAAKQAVAGLMQARAREGERLVQVLQERIARLHELAAQAEPLVPCVVQKQQQRFLDRWQEALTATDAAHTVSPEALRERALNEAAAFAIRIDVAEELARLRSHLDEIARLLKKGGEVGKRLDFLIQELLREANTLGSKAASLELTNVSVEMKVAIEQMREQVQNLE